VRVKAGSLNHHDLWSLRGVGLPAERLPMILGCDAAGIDESTDEEVVVHAVVNTDGWRGDDTTDPGRTLLSEKHQGSLADYVIVPARNVVPKPPELSWGEAACLSTAWLTAYRMLFTKSGLRPGHSVLVQGASGGVASACIAMARAAGFRVYATARTEDKQAAALELGAHEAFASGARLPERVDAVMETVGEATWSHSLKSLKPGGRVVVSGATSGAAPSAELNRVFFLQLEVIGSTMGTKDELAALIAFLQSTGLRPRIDRSIPMESAAEGLSAMAAGDLVGKIVLEF
jgi:NADPH:quinone reductase-like Zn-dependent oxidoreductase